MAKPRKRKTETINFQPEPDVEALLKAELRTLPDMRAMKTRICNWALRMALKEAGEYLRKEEQMKADLQSKP